ncbi:NAD(P)H-dependent flavin oxidoreductase [Massilia sp. PWRC2]|uniref:NAD(P)H-dependent flavin oxidoreductase n=1 Tax=Massilia sp. PWRC2 TaxID=2804626 RepID=UPI003CE708DF
MDALKLFNSRRLPVIQGPMAGGFCTPELIAAVCNAGGLGSLPGSLLSVAALRDQVAAIRSLTNQPFFLNFFVQSVPAPDDSAIAAASQLLRPIWQQLGWDELPRPSQWCQDFHAQFETLLELRPALASFTFDILSSQQVERLHGAGILVLGTVTTVAEAVAWQAVGADAVIASGIEAGGHRGTFIGRQEEATLTARELWSQVVAAVRLPVVAAGAIMDGRDIGAALALGVSAVQMGTAFLVSDEAAVHPAYKQRLLSANAQTRLTRAISGRYARGIENDFMREMEAVEQQVPAYPVQNALTGSIRAAAAAAGNSELMSLWAGSGVNRARPMSVAALMNTLAAEMTATSLK